MNFKNKRHRRTMIGDNTWKKDPNFIKRERGRPKKSEKTLDTALGADEKTCAKCGYIKNKELDFHKNMAICKTCKAEYNAQYYAQKKISKKTYNEIEDLIEKIRDLSLKLNHVEEYLTLTTHVTGTIERQE